MKSSTQVFASLVAALAMFSQPAIATYTYAERQFTVDRNAINVGTENRKSLLECSQAKPCVQDRIAIDSYKEVFSKSGKLQEAKIVLYNTSFAPASIEVISSDGKLRSVEFIDGAKAGFKDLGDFLKAASAGIIGPFQCTTNLFECLGDSRYGIEKNERTIKLQAGDLIRISRGSDAAFAYTLASTVLDQVELLGSIRGMTSSKVASPSLLRSYSPTLRRKIIEGFIIKEIKEKYTYEMLIKEFSSTAIKKSASEPQDLFNNALEIAQNIPEDFWKSMKDGTVTAKAAGDGLDTLVQVVSAKGAVFLNSSLLVSQSVNIRARYSASELAHDKPLHIIIAGLKNSSTNSNQPIATKPSSSNCQSAISQIRSSLPSSIVNSVRSRSSQIGNFGSGQPKERGEFVIVSIQSLKGYNFMLSHTNTNLLQISSKVIKSCPKVGMVSFFFMNASLERSYGSVNNRAYYFPCVNRAAKNEWEKNMCF